MLSSRIFPPRDCDRCSRLRQFILDQRAKNPDWHNAPVRSFGPDDAQLLIVGLAPGMQGANRTGRPFTGDYAGKILYEALLRHGLAKGRFEERADDGLEPFVRITNAVRCVPPQNKPVGAEINTCNMFLKSELTTDPAPQIILVLGRIAHEATIKALGLKQKHYPFSHGAVHRLDTGQQLLCSYHFSRYNMNTGRMTQPMVEGIFSKIGTLIA